MIIEPGQRIKIISSKRQCSANSIGFMAYQRPKGPYNAWFSEVIFTRFGKGGKPRLSLMTISSPIIEYDLLPPERRAHVEENKVALGLEPLEIRRRNKVEYFIDTEIEVYPLEFRDMLKLNNIEFQAYISSLSLFIYRLVKQRGLFSVKVEMLRLPRGLQNLIIDLPRLDNKNLLNIDPPYWWLAILYCRFIDNINKGTFYETYFNNFINSTINRVELLTQLRKYMATSNKIISEYTISLQHTYSSMYRKVTENQ